MPDDFTILINPNSANAGRTIRFFSQRNRKFQLCRTRPELERCMHASTRQGKYEFIVCGGDGTVNMFIDSFMSLRPVEQARIRLAVLPCGKANDLARELNIPGKPGEAYRAFQSHRIKKVDIIQVNGSYFITGGGLGLPADVIADLGVSTANRMLRTLFGDRQYLLVVLKKILFGYAVLHDVYINSDHHPGNYMLLCVQNQSFIGKRFQLCPGAKHDDGFMDVCLLPKTAVPKDLITLRNVLRGRHLEMPGTIYYRKRTLTITTPEKTSFMADGELLEHASEFKLRVLPRAITVLY